MAEVFFKAPCPGHLSDEILLIETSGEMPEVALADSIHQMSPLSERDLACLRAAAARAYETLIRRDLDPANLGRASFRGLDRALANISRLNAYLVKLTWAWPAGLKKSLACELADYLAAEAAALAAGRPYASAPAEVVCALAHGLGLAPRVWQALSERMEALPWLDFLGLRAMKSLEVTDGAAKRRGQKGGLHIMEIVDENQRPLARAALPALDAAGRPDPEARARADLVWSLLRLPAAVGH